MEIAGMFVALAAWLAAAHAGLLAGQALVRALPAEWREHPEVGPGYAAYLESGFGAVLRTAATVAPGIAVLALLAVALAALDRPVLAFVGATVGALLGTQRVVAEQRAQVRAFAAAHGFAYPADPRRHLYVAAVCVSYLAAGLTGAFAGLAAWGLLA